MRTQEQIIKDRISHSSLAQLLDEWELTNEANIRGYIMEELENRNPEEFDEWLVSEADDLELRKFFKTT